MNDNEKSPRYRVGQRVRVVEGDSQGRSGGVAHTGSIAPPEEQPTGWDGTPETAAVLHRGYLVKVTDRGEKTGYATWGAPCFSGTQAQPPLKDLHVADY